MQAAILTSPVSREQSIASSAAAGPATTSIAKQNNSLRSIRKPPSRSVVRASHRSHWIADALPEQPHPVLLLRANDLVFRAFRRCSSCRSRPIPIAVAGCAARYVPFEQVMPPPRDPQGRGIDEDGNAASDRHFAAHPEDQDANVVIYNFFDEG